jgi:CheY-like chemotaxis protein
LLLDRSTFDAHPVIEQAVEICRGDIAAAGHRLALDLGAAAHFVNADPARLQQVFWNLIKNSVKFTPRGGEITVRTRNSQTCPAGSPGEWLVVEVSDNGVGIEPGVLTRLFEPFEHFNPPFRQRFGGLGLGLAISRTIIEAHGGLLSAHSEGPSQGATFRVELAVAPAATESVEPRALPTTALGRDLRLLVVEDDASTLDVMAKVLRRRGYTVTTANSLAAALEIAAAGGFDLVISDIGLSDGSGLELMRRLRTEHGIPGIALSGFGMSEDIQKSKDAGFYAHLTKPVDIQKLEALIQQIPT